jgi:hypothetical protein
VVGEAADRGSLIEPSSTASGTCFGQAANGKAVHRDWFGVFSSVLHERFQAWQKTGVFEKLMKRMVEYYARERGGVGWRWQAMDSKSCAPPLGASESGKNPTDRGKLGAKINLLVDERGGAPLSVVLSGANRHTTKYPPSI